MSTKSWIRDYFNRLADNIANDHIPNERTLCATVEIPLPGWGKGKTLLQGLEYETNNVQPQYPIRVGTSKPRVDFMLGRDSNRWMLDLKKPGDRCDRPKYVEQLQSYMSQEKVSLGVLFNGTTALAYINPEYSALVDIVCAITEQERFEEPRLDLKKYPVREASMSDGNTREMCDFFRLFRYDGASPDIEALAKRLAREYSSKIQRHARTAKRQADIQTALFETLSDPSEQVVKVIIEAEIKLSALRATPEEVLQLWPTTLSMTSEACTSGKRLNNRARNQF